MAKRKAAHHKGTHQARSAKVRAAANADPNTRCWRCGRTLAEHPRHKTGRRPFWTAGHVVDGVSDSPLLPEASVCNYGHGARVGGQRMKAKAARKASPAPEQAPRRTDLTW